jgi:hypothetical protein
MSEQLPVDPVEDKLPTHARYSPIGEPQAGERRRLRQEACRE